MNIQINKWKKIHNLLGRRTPNNLYRDIVLKKVENNSLFIKHKLCIVISFQKVWYEKGKERYFTMEKPNKYYLSQGIKINSSEESC